MLNPKRFDETFYANTAKEFIQIVDDSRRGDCVIWDEAGVSLSSRKWHSLSNILTGEVLQTYRVNYLTVFFVTPDLSFVDVQARRLMTLFVENKRYTEKEGHAWLYNISVDRKTGKIYFPWYTVKPRRGGLINLPHIKIPRKAINKVPKVTWKRIHEKELVFKHKTRKKNLAVIEAIEQEENTMTIYDMINEVDSNREKYTNPKGELDRHLVQLHLSVGRDKAAQIVKFIERGWEGIPKEE